MFIKSLSLVTLAILIRGTLPRYRIDQLISLNWKFLIFLNIFLIVQMVIILIVL